ncbi:MAG: dCMP deaminase family protein [Bacteriovoracaceae bacterium]|nr:dCMP deaminase family protein [Bacteriovoracaceae bacterium]
MNSALNWDEYFMLQAIVASFKSKDPNTKVGCVFVDHKNHQISMGYNGQIAGLDEAKLSWKNAKDLPLDQQKYAYVVHSEANAILHSKGELEGSKLYVTLFPCHECAKMLATVRVKEVIYLSDKYIGSVENNIAKKILDLSGITTRQLQLKSELMNDLHVHFEKTLSEQ